MIHQRIWADSCEPPRGFPIRTSPDIAPAHGSPRLIAVFHVLHRRLTPRHSPYALSSFHPRDAEKLIFHFTCYAVGKVEGPETVLQGRLFSARSSRPPSRAPPAHPSRCTRGPRLDRPGPVKLLSTLKVQRWSPRPPGRLDKTARHTARLSINNHCDLSACCYLVWVTRCPDKCSQSPSRHAASRWR